MLYLSRFYPDLRSNAVRRDLADPYQLHRTLMHAFPDTGAGGPGRVLFRVDVARETGQPSLLVQSDRRPDWAGLPRDGRGRPYTCAPPEWKPFNPVLGAGQRLRFRLCANPSAKHGSGSKEDRQSKRPGRHGRRDALLTVELQRKWLDRKANAGGFRVIGVQVVPEGWVTGEKGNGTGRHEMKFYAVRFDGVLEVTDPAKFLETVRQGIGSAKGFGFGLLSLARVS